MNEVASRVANKLRQMARLGECGSKRNEYNGLPCEYLPKGLKPEDAEELMNKGTRYRFIDGTYKWFDGLTRGYNTYLLLLEKEDADRLGVEYCEFPFWGMDESQFPCNVLGDDGIVHYVKKLKVTEGKFLGNNGKMNKRINKFALGDLCYGFWNNFEDNGYLTYHMSPLILSGMYQKKTEIWFPVMGKGQYRDDPRFHAFVEILLKTGNGTYAAMCSYNIQDASTGEAKYRTIIQSKDAKEALAMAGKDIVEKALREKGINQDPKSWVVSNMIEIINDLKSAPGPQSKAAALNGLEKLWDKMKEEAPKEKGNGKNDPGLSPEELARLNGTSTETVTPTENVSESDRDREVSFTFNVPSEESRVSQSDI